MNRLPIFDLIDLNLLQAFDAYNDMELEEACDAITDKWPEQMAMLLVIFQFTVRTKYGKKLYKHIQAERRDGKSYYKALMFSCRGRS